MKKELFRFETEDLIKFYFDQSDCEQLQRLPQAAHVITLQRQPDLMEVQLHTSLILIIVRRDCLSVCLSVCYQLTAAVRLRAGLISDTQTR